MDHLRVGEALARFIDESDVVAGCLAGILLVIASGVFTLALMLAMTVLVRVFSLFSH